MVNADFVKKKLQEELQEEQCEEECECFCDCSEDDQCQADLAEEKEDEIKPLNRKKEKKEKKDKREEQIEELADRVKRQMAEFDNFRKRTEKEKCQMFEIGVKSIVEKILPVIDNFERGLVSVPAEMEDSAFVNGMDKIYKQLVTELGSVGVKAIEAVGNEFDPCFHNAVMHVEDEDEGENVVVEEFQKGYVYRETVIRHSMVKVAN